MTTVIDFLDRLNRKERFFLIGQALGNRRFTPDPAFLLTVGAATRVTFPDADRVHCFMDFHLDWLYAALVLASDTGTGPFPSPAFVASDPLGPTWNINTNQEDIDLLLAFESEGTTHLVMVEAKAATGWTVSQVASKVRRLRHLFGDDGSNVAGVEPHFVLLSPKRSLALDMKLESSFGSTPAWMLRGGRLAWARLDMPTDRLVIGRCDEHDQPTKVGNHWHVK